MPEQKRGGKRGRKTGNKVRKPSFQRYWGFQKGYDNRAELHAAARMRRFDAMVADSRLRRRVEGAG